MRQLRGAAIAASAAAILAFCAPFAASAEDKPVEIRLVDQFNALFGSHPGFRANHAKGVVLEGTFTPAPSAASLSSAVFLQKKPTPITVRFSNGGGLPDAPDTHPSGLTRGMAIKYHLPDGSEVDMVCISLNGFPVSNGEDFLSLLKALGTSGPDTPKPTPLDTFLAAHPATAKIVSIPQPVPVSYATLPFYGVNAFKFTNAKGKTQFGRYRIVPVAKEAYLSNEAAAKRSPNALAEDIRARVAKAPVRFKLLVQLAQPGDPTNDATQVWPANRPTVELGEISITKAVPDSLAAEKALLFLPTNLTAGIDESDDPLIDVRTAAYAESYGRRSQ
jgi:catalase